MLVTVARQHRSLFFPSAVQRNIDNRQTLMQKGSGQICLLTDPLANGSHWSDQDMGMYGSSNANAATDCYPDRLFGCAETTLLTYFTIKRGY